MKKLSLKVYAFFIILTLLVGSLSGLISRKGIESYEMINKSSLSPPDFIFPIVWSILFVLMGISVSRIFLSNSKDTNKALLVFFIQLLVNFLWSPIFFNLQAFGFAFFWIILLWILIIVMIYLFAKIDKPAALLQIPYLLWVTFAAYLTLSTWILNR